MAPLSFRDFADLSDQIETPPLAPLTLAALARRHGWDVAVRDLDRESLPSWRPDLVGISINTACAPMAYLLAREYRDRGVRVVLGGSHASIAPSEGLRHADSVIVGEAEAIIGDVLSDAAADRLKPLYHGAWGPMDEVPDPVEYMNGIDGYSGEYPVSVVYQSTRGCRFNCSYCSVIRINGRGQRRRSPDAVVEHLRYVVAHRGGPVQISFVDDDLAADREGALIMCEAIASAGLPVHWSVQTSMGIGLDSELLDAAVRAGLNAVFIGFEGLRRQGLLDVNKKNRPHLFAEVTAALHRRDVTVAGGFLIGLEGDRFDDMLELGPMVESLGVDRPTCAVLMPLPGTSTFAEYVDGNRVLTFDWACYQGANAVIRPKSMSPEESEIARLRAMLYWARAGRRRRQLPVDALRAVIERRKATARASGWVSYEADPRDVEQILTTSRQDANAALATAVTLATTAPEDRQGVPPLAGHVDYEAR